MKIVRKQDVRVMMHITRPRLIFLFNLLSFLALSCMSVQGALVFFNSGLRPPLLSIRRIVGPLVRCWAGKSCSPAEPPTSQSQPHQYPPTACIHRAAGILLAPFAVFVFIHKLFVKSTYCKQSRAALQVYLSSM